MKEIRKIVTILMVVILAVFICPGMANAETETETDTYTFGDRVTGVVLENGILKISGTGTLSILESNIDKIKADTRIKTIEIGIGITAVETDSFEGCSNIESVVFSDSVESIADGSFAGCSSLKYIIGTEETAAQIFANQFENVSFKKIGEHSLKEVKKIEATCTEAGNTAYYMCEYCRKCFSDANGETEIEAGSWILPADGHDMDAHAAVAQTCTTAGNSAYWECKTCKKYFEDAEGKNEIAKDSWIIPADGHDMDAHAAVAQTCTTAGNSAYWECKTCKKYFEDAEGKNEIAKDSWIIPADGHDMDAHAAVAQTCTTAGNSAYWECKTCKKYFEDAEGKNEIAKDSWIIPADGHSMKSHAAVAQTCTTAGNSAYWECKTCKKYFEDAEGKNEITKDSWIIPADGHDMDAHAAVAQTCTTAGNSAYWECKTCKKYFEDAEGKNEIAKDSWIIAADGHSMKSHAAVAQTCTTAGNSAYWECETCKKYFEDADGKKEIAKDSWIIAADGHSMKSHAAVAQTCTTAGNSAYWECETCKKYFEDADGNKEIAKDSWIIAADGHSMKSHAAVAQTCTTAGNSAYWECETCKKYFEDTDGNKEIAKDSWIIAADGHTFTKEVVADKYRKSAADCTHSAVYYKSCHCGEKGTETFEYGEPLGHNKEHHEMKAASCFEDGNIEYWYCQRCEKYFIDEACTKPVSYNDTILQSANAHRKRKHKAIEAGCTSDGNIEYLRVKVCHKLFSDVTCTEEITLEDTIIPARHKIGETVKENEVAPTCEKDGSYQNVARCEDCGKEIFTETVITSKLGHSMKKVDAVQATCTNNGNTEYYECTRCQKLFADKNGTKEITRKSTLIAMKDHVEADAVKENEVDATCEEDGGYDLVVRCRNCNEILSSEHIDLTKLGHTLKKIEGKDPTEKKEGSIEYYVCTVCKKLFDDSDAEKEITLEDTVIPVIASDKNNDNNKSKAKKVDGVGTISADGKTLKDESKTVYYISTKVTKTQLRKGLKVAVKKSNCKFKITAITKKKGKISSGTVELVGIYNNNSTKLTVPATVKIGGVKFKVTSIGKKALVKAAKLTTLVVGTNVTKIGVGAFSGLSKLNNLTFKTKKIKTVGNGSFKGIKSKPKVTVPKNCYKKYQKAFKKAGMPKKVKYIKK